MGTFVQHKKNKEHLASLLPMFLVQVVFIYTNQVISNVLEIEIKQS